MSRQPSLPGYNLRRWRKSTGRNFDEEEETNEICSSGPNLRKPVLNNFATPGRLNDFVRF